MPFQDLPMSQSQTIAFPHALDPHAMGRRPSRRWHPTIWVARLVTLWGAAGAVLAQTAAFGLVARLALDLNSATLPGLTASVIGLALGALAMAGSRALATPPRIAA
jgi:hypothetical protein